MGAVRRIAHEAAQTKVGLTIVGFATGFELIVLAWRAAKREAPPADEVEEFLRLGSTCNATDEQMIQLELRQGFLCEVAWSGHRDLLRRLEAGEDCSNNPELGAVRR